MTSHSESSPPPIEDSRKPRRRSWKKVAVLTIVLGLFAAVVIIFRNDLTLEQLARHEDSMRRLEHEHPVAVYLAAFVLYVTVTGLSVPVASVLTLAYGWYFRFWNALVVVSFAATAGATVAFLLSRYLFRDEIERHFAGRVKRFNEAIDRDGAFYLFALRLTPVVPFWLINAVMGVTRLKTRTFWWVSQVGMLPNIAVYVYAGASAPSLRYITNHGFAGLPIWRLMLAFLLIGCFPLVARRVLRRFRRESA